MVKAFLKVLPYKTLEGLINYFEQKRIKDISNNKLASIVQEYQKMYPEKFKLVVEKIINLAAHHFGGRVCKFIQVLDVIFKAAESVLLENMSAYFNSIIRALKDCDGSFINLRFLVMNNNYKSFKHFPYFKLEVTDEK